MQFLKKAVKVAMMGLVLPSMVGASLYAGTLVTVGGVEVPDKILEIFQKADPSFNYSALPMEQKKAFLEQYVIPFAVAYNAALKDGLDKTEEYKVITMDSLTQFWRAKQIESVATTISVTADEAEKFYKENIDRFTLQAAVLRHVLVEKEEEAKAVIAELGKVPKGKTKDKFSELAKSRSKDAGSGANGGLLELNLNDQVLDKNFADAAKKMPVGTYTKTPVASQFGYHVIYLEKRDKPVTETFADNKDKIMEYIKTMKANQVVASKLSKLREETKVIYPGEK